MTLLLALYATARMAGIGLWVDVPTAGGIVRLPNTYTTVDHPFHVARADVLWRELVAGNVPRWIGQHQGGYPVEFYPLGEAWLEVAIRALSAGTLPPEGAHTIAVIVLFLVPGLAFFALAREDGLSPAAGVLALILHVSLPGGWYDGGYTELVQWGLVTNVAGAVAAFLMIPAFLRFVRGGTGWAGAAAAGLATAAIYCNPRSIVGLAAIAAGVWTAALLSANASDPRKSENLGDATRRLAIVAGLVVLLTAPELLALLRFGDLYAFVRYSGYEGIADYVWTSTGSVTPVVLVLAIAGIVLAAVSRARTAQLAVASSLVVYVLLTLAVAFVPFVGGLAPQLEPTRLMPLQRLLTLYLAASAAWLALSWVQRRWMPEHRWIPAAVTLALGGLVLGIQTRPLAGYAPDPAHPEIPRVSLYPVETSGRSEQMELQAAVRAADAGAVPGTALLVLGSAMSWHQQLWAPLWTTRPLFYDNWLWTWRSGHAGTPGYVFASGNHYPDPDRALDPRFLERHGIGAVVVTGETRAAASSSPVLRPLREGTYDAYAVVDPVTTMTSGGENVSAPVFANGMLAGTAERPGRRASIRTNWHPRWEANGDHHLATVAEREDGYIDVEGSEPMRAVTLHYSAQPLDWAARALAGIGLVGVLILTVRSARYGHHRRRWYAG